MASFRSDKPTPSGGAYAIGVYVKVDGLVEVDEKDADGVVITEYDADGGWLAETVGTLRQPAAS